MDITFETLDRWPYGGKGERNSPFKASYPKTVALLKDELTRVNARLRSERGYTMADKELSGRSLDADVAERVMGWQRQEGYNYWMSFPSSDTFKLHVLIAAWKPSESIEAAVRVLTEFDIWNINKTDHPDFADRPYSVMVGFHESEHSSRVKYFEVQAPTIPEGICRAALAASEKR